NKDQSYVLYTLTQEQLEYIQFPLGGLTKPETRRLAHAYHLPVADKAESQEICFVGNNSYAEFVARHRPDVASPGEIVNKTGEVLGEHKGLVNHTIGQRRGLGIAGTRPYFVLQLDTGANRLVVGDREDAEAVAIDADSVSLVSENWDGEPFEADIVVRYRGIPHRATVAVTSGDDRTVHIDIPGDKGPIASPGQAVVFYRGDEVL